MPYGTKPLPEPMLTYVKWFCYFKVCVTFHVCIYCFSIWPSSVVSVTVQPPSAMSSRCTRVTMAAPWFSARQNVRQTNSQSATTSNRRHTYCMVTFHKRNERWCSRWDSSGFILWWSSLYQPYLFPDHSNLLTHWGRVTHICVGNITIDGPNNGLSPCRRQAIIWTNAGILLIEPLAANFSEI